MIRRRISTGTQFFDTLLEGGFETGSVTTIYGPAATGKTTICMLAAISRARRGKKTIFVDTEAGFSTERMRQVDPDYREHIKKINFLLPKTFNEQKKVFLNIRRLSKGASLIIFDTMTALYRVEKGKAKDIGQLNEELQIELETLYKIARERNIPVVVTNQVYADVYSRNKVRMVGGDILKYGSRCLIELEKNNKTVTARLKKHREIPTNSEMRFRIVKEGIEER